jgi:hypothetical protein
VEEGGDLGESPLPESGPIVTMNLKAAVDLYLITAMALALPPARLTAQQVWRPT